MGPELGAKPLPSSFKIAAAHKVDEVKETRDQAVGCLRSARAGVRRTRR
jgi:hypothetical protein